LIDAQVSNAHTLGLGAIEIPRTQFLQRVAELGQRTGLVGSWSAFTPRLIQPD
jgi:leucyl/phenylalanyl-tRNA--protein transferase